MIACRDRRLCEYPLQIVRLRQLFPGPQELELLYPDGDWLAAFGVANLTIYEDSPSE